jgi:hypothetical protein
VGKWEVADADLQQVNIQSSKQNEPVIITGQHDNLICIGIGTDAAVFAYEDLPYAFKVFAKDKLEKMEMEKKVYETLGSSPYFPVYYGSGSHYIVISWEQGITLYDCLLKGIHIPKRAIEDVEEARSYAMHKELNPRDIHLKNILLHEGRAKIIDVSEYMNPGNDFRWEYLKRGYDDFYPLIDGKPIPLWVIETVRKWYNQQNQTNFNYLDFIKKIKKTLLK